MNYVEFEELDVAVDGPVLIVTMQRPGNGREHTELSQLFSTVRSDRDIAVVVLTGVGDTFMPLADMSWYATVDEDDWLRLMREAKWLLRDMVELPQPIVVAMNGDAVGLGASILTFGDVIIAADGATIRDSHISMALVAGDGGAISLPLSIGLHRTKAFYLLNQTLDARELLACGVVAEVVDRDAVLPRAVAVARELAALPREAVQWTKAAINRPAVQAVAAGADGALGHEGWTWHLQQAQQRHVAIRQANSSADPTDER
jgi:enoyl-CoA hydratase/carnithine racemase